MTVSYRCAYCGSMQTWSGTGPRVCQSCGATQPERPGSTFAGSVTTGAGASPRRHGVRVALWVLGGLFLLGGVLRVVRKPGQVSSRDLPVAVLQSRILAVNNPAVRTLPAGSDLSAVDLVRSAPANSANLFDTRLLSVATPRPMNDIDDNLWFLGEVTNRSPDHTAIAPSVQLAIVKNGHIVETRDLSFNDLPPRGHAPVAFKWGGEPSEVQHMVYRWKPVTGYRETVSNHAQLEVNVDGRKMIPGSVTVNFAYTYRFVTAQVQGTVTNRGNATARGAKLYLTLYDAKGRVSGFKVQPLNPVAPGEQVRYDMEAEQWGDPVATVDVEALPNSETNL